MQIKTEADALVELGLRLRGTVLVQGVLYHQQEQHSNGIAFSTIPENAQSRKTPSTLTFRDGVDSLADKAILYRQHERKVNKFKKIKIILKEQE